MSVSQSVTLKEKNDLSAALEDRQLKFSLKIPMGFAHLFYLLLLSAMLQKKYSFLINLFVFAYSPYYICYDH